MIHDHGAMTECNVVANDLTLLARKSIHTTIWLRQTPLNMDRLIANDCNPDQV